MRRSTLVTNKKYMERNKIGQFKKQGTLRGFMWKSFFSLIFIILMAGGVIWYNKSHPTIVYQDVKIDKSDEMFATKIAQLKSDIADKLMACESGGLTEDTGIIIFDTNAKASIGQFQFQKATVIHYYKLLYGKDITGKEAILIALDTDKAKELAIDVMFKTKNKAGKDWVNCTARHNLDAQIDLVKKLEA